MHVCSTTMCNDHKYWVLKVQVCLSLTSAEPFRLFQCTYPNENSIASIKILPSTKSIFLNTRKKWVWYSRRFNSMFKLKIHSPKWKFDKISQYKPSRQLFMGQIPRDNTAGPNEISTKQILFPTSKWKFDQANTHPFLLKGTKSFRPQKFGQTCGLQPES